MNPNLKALNDQLEALSTESAALIAKADRTDEDKARIKALPGLIAEKKAEIEAEKALVASAADASTFLNGNGTLQSALGGVPPQAKETVVRVATRSRPKNFLSIEGKNREQAAESAYRFGMFLGASLRGNQKALTFCKDNGIAIVAAGHVEGENEDGGYLVPPEFENDLIDLREKFGKFRQFARNSLMTSETKSRPRRVGGLEAYFVDEGEAADESKGKWDRVGLTARKLMVNTRASSEWNEDAIIDTGDTLAGEIAYAFAKKEDLCGYLGDGTAAYGRIEGLFTKLKRIYTATGGPGLVLASGNAWGEITIGDFTKMVGALPEYADGPGVRWHCHKTFYANVMLRIMMDAGGIRPEDIASGAVYRNPHFMGYPVEFAQALPKTEANSQVPVALGNLALSTDYGDRRRTTVAMSEHALFSSDQIAIRGTERFDINNHDVGTANEVGPVVGLITQAA